jgi:hypothetical protein
VFCPVRDFFFQVSNVVLLLVTSFFPGGFGCKLGI